MKPAALEPRTARIATWTLLAWEHDTREGDPTEGKQKGGGGLQQSHTLRYEPSNLETGASFLMRFVKVVFPNFRSLRLREQARRS